jgi:uroporphyrinogen-III synthase
MAQPGFNGLRVAAFESRMADEMARLITRYRGEPLVAPSMREVPLTDHHEALEFGEHLLAGRIDMLILLTGVGTRTLVDVLQTRHPRDVIKTALGRVTLVARGPKPVAALKELGLAPQITVPEPNTWRDLLRILDATVAGKRVAVQEYGVPNDELLDGLRTRGAQVTTVRIYRWALPEDVAPLRQVLASMLDGRVAVALVTNAVQVDHVELVLAKDGNLERFRERLSGMVVASIGPTASERLRSHGWPVDLEPSHPKMGILVKETSERVQDLLRRKPST